MKKKIIITLLILGVIWVLWGIFKKGWFGLYTPSASRIMPSGNPIVGPVPSGISKTTCTAGGCIWMPDSKHIGGGWCNCGTYNNY